MNWGDVPQSMLGASAQLKQAQESLEKALHEEVNRRCQQLHIKIAVLLHEREATRESLREVVGRAPTETEYFCNIQDILAKLQQNDAKWFPANALREYLSLLENPPVDT